MLCTIALNSSIIICSCAYTQKGTTLRVITNDFLNYVVNKKRYRINLFIFVCAFVWFHKWICYDFSCFMHWMCECCVMFWRKVQWQNFDFCVWLLHEFWHDFETCYFFSHYSWLDMILCGIHSEWSSSGASVSLVFSSFSVLITIALLVHTVFDCPLRCLVEITSQHIIMLLVFTLGASPLHWHFVQAWLRSHI